MSSSLQVATLPVAAGCRQQHLKCAAGPELDVSILLSGIYVAALVQANGTVQFTRFRKH